MRGLWEAHEWIPNNWQWNQDSTGKGKSNSWGSKSLEFFRTHTRLYIYECLPYIDRITLIYCDCLWTDFARIVACWVRKLKEEDEFQLKSIPFVPMDMQSSPSMSCSWEVYEWFMSRRRVANAAQPLILDFFTSFNYQHICRIICFGFNTFTRNS